MDSKTQGYQDNNVEETIGFKCNDRNPLEKEKDRNTLEELQIVEIVKEKEKVLQEQGNKTLKELIVHSDEEDVVGKFNQHWRKKEKEECRKHTKCQRRRVQLIHCLNDFIVLHFIEWPNVLRCKCKEPSATKR